MALFHFSFLKACITSRKIGRFKKTQGLLSNASYILHESQALFSLKIKKENWALHFIQRKRIGSVVECLT